MTATIDTQTCPETNVDSTPRSSPSPGTQTSSSSQSCRDTQSCTAAAGLQLAADQSALGTHPTAVGGTQTFPAAIVAASPNTTPPQGNPTATGGQVICDTHRQRAPGGWLRDPVIGVLAEVLDDLEKVRIANANRVRILTRDEADSDGENRGFGLTEDHPEVAKLALTVKALEAAEHDAILNLQRALRKHPLAAFQKRHRGLGEKQFARLLAVVGDPYWNDLHQRPRTVSELWAYCGFHVIRASGSGQRGNDTQMRTAASGSTVHPDGHHELDNQGRNAVGVAPKRQRGQQSNWSEDARKRVWVIASAMPKFPGGHYEQVYRAAREKYVDATHPADCMRCGPAGKPALAGSELSDGHKHARAIRIVAKELLKDIWRESRDLYEGEQA